MNRPSDEDIEARVRTYMSDRGEGEVPPGLVAAARSQAQGPVPRSGSRRPAWAALGSAAVVIVVASLVALLVLAPKPIVPVSVPSGSPTAVVPSGATPTGSSAAPTASPVRLSDTFPKEIVGMPVQTVAQALTLIASGRLDGRSAAVAGYYDSEGLPCPYPEPYPQSRETVLNGYCHLTTLRDAATSPFDDLSNPIPGIGLEPFLLAGTSGSDALDAHLSTSPGLMPVPVIFIGHVADPRAWQCFAELRAECRQTFVVDLVAWVDGSPTAVPSLAGALAGAEPGSSVVSVTALTASDVPSIDPRIQFADDSAVSLASVRGPVDADGTAQMSHVVVDDASGAVLATKSLVDDPAYAPGLLVVSSVDRDRNEAPNPRVHFSVQRAGTDILTGVIEIDQFAGSVLPAALEPGDYGLRAWYTSGSDGTGTPTDVCDTTITIGSGDEIALTATWPPKQGSCTFDGQLR